MGFNRGQQRRTVQAHRAVRRTHMVSAGTAAALCSLLLTGGMPRVMADTSGGVQSAFSGRTISLRLSQADIYTVVNELENKVNQLSANDPNQTKFNVAIIEGSQPYHLINVALDHVTPEQALHYIAASAGAAVALNSDGVYILHPLQSQDGASEAMQYGAPPPAQDANTGSVQQSTSSETPVTIHKLYLKYVSPDEVLKKMGWTQDMLDDPEAAFDNAPPAVSISQNQAPLNVIEQPLVQNNGYQQPSVPAGQGTTGPNQANDYDQAHRYEDEGNNSNQAHQFGFPGGGFGGGGGFPGGGGFNGGGGFPGGGGFNGGGGFPGGGGFNGGRGGGIGGGIGGRQQQITLPDGVDHIYAIEGDNSLLVFATQAGYDTVHDIINALDVRARQVQIKVEFVTATVSDIDSFGINFSLIPTPGLAISLPTASNNPANSTGSTAGNSTSGTNGSTTGTTGSTGTTGTTGSNSGTNNGSTNGSTTTSNTGVVNNPGASYLQFAYGNVAAQLYALLTKTKSKLVSAPIVSTTNNVPANIFFEQDIPFTVPQTTIVPNGGTVTNNIQQIEQIITELPVDPRINGDDTVTLRLTPTISTPVGSPTSTGATATQSETIDTTRTVRSGETMVIGGLVSKTENDSRSSVPLLGSLPIIGGLFRSHYINNTDSELLIFVTPTIIDEDNQASSDDDTAEPQGAVGVNAIPGAQPNAGGAVTP